jgi:hypothetical protein
VITTHGPSLSTDDDEAPAAMDLLSAMSTLPPVASLQSNHDDGDGGSGGGADSPGVVRRSSGDGGGGGGARRGSVSVVSSWEMTMVSGVNAGTIAREKAKGPRAVDRIAGGGIAAPPNNFAGRSNTTQHTVGGSYVPDRLLEAHRRMHAAERSSDADGSASASATTTTGATPMPKSLQR